MCCATAARLHVGAAALLLCLAPLVAPRLQPTTTGGGRLQQELDHPPGATPNDANIANCSLSIGPLNCSAGCKCSSDVAVWNTTEPATPPRKPCIATTSPTEFTYAPTYQLSNATSTPGYDIGAGTFKLGAAAGKSGGKYADAVLLPDGRVLFVPCYTDRIGLYSPSNDSFALSTVSVNPATNYSDFYTGGVLVPSLGRVVFVAHNAARIGLYDYTTDTFSLSCAETHFPSGGFKWRGGVLLPDSRVLFVPDAAVPIGLYDPFRDTFELGHTTRSQADDQYEGGVLVPSGMVVFVVRNAEHVAVFNPHSGEVTLSNPGLSAGGWKYTGGVLIPDGRVVLAPVYSETVGLFDPTANRLSEGARVRRSGAPFVGEWGGLYSGGVLLADGRVAFIPSGTQADRIGL